jgi:peptidyl-dipeptidase Dcp
VGWSEILTSIFKILKFRNFSIYLSLIIIFNIKLIIIIMKKTILILMPLCLIFFASCDSKDKELSDNPFFTEFDTPYGAPPFDLIQTEHFKPAFEEGMRQQLEEIQAIIDNQEEPNFENTIVAYDRSGAMLRRINPVFGGLRGAESTPELQEIAQEIVPALTAHSNEIRFNQDLFEKIKTVYDKKESLDLNHEQMKVVEKIYDDFARNGAALPEEEREKLKDINERISSVSLQLGDNLLAENGDFKLIIEDEADLIGLPEDVINAAAEEAEKADMNGKWVFTLAKPSWIPFVQFSERRDLREEIFTAYANRGDNDNEYDNKELFVELMVLRQQLAEILGYKNYAEFFISEQMAENPENVYDFLNTVWEPALARATAERDELQAIMDRDGKDEKLEAWDWWYYAEILRKEKYDLDEDEIKPYFTLENVKNGNFILSNKLFGITFEARPEVPVYHEEVEAYEVFDKDGTSLGILYIDPHPREGKRSGAWCGTYRSGYYDEDGNKVTPIVTIVMNFTRPSGDNPAMLSWDETTTYFHEFGHALHNFFADGRYFRTSRSVPRDFVELPSQILENWAAEPELLREYALHYETGKPIPDYLIEKINSASLFNQGFVNAEYIAAAILDMDWHTAGNITMETCANEFEKTSMDRIGLLNEIVPRYRTTNFGHLFSYGYAAGYYVYRWAGVLDADAFMAFKNSDDLFNQELAGKFRKYILAENSLWEGMEAYKKFRGEEPDINHFLERSGLK